MDRWGTSYIKSAKFGGQLQINKLSRKSQWQSKKAEFAEKMEAEFNNAFFGGGSKKTSSGNEEQGEQKKVASTTVTARGGTHEIATILTDMYSPTFKPDFKQWLKSIPDYPKPFVFQLGSIVDLLNFRANDLFSEKKIDWGCEANALKEEEREDGSSRWYYEDENSTRRYCPYADRNALDYALQARRTSLQIAMDIRARMVMTVKRRMIFY